MSLVMQMEVIHRMTGQCFFKLSSNFWVSYHPGHLACHRWTVRGQYILYSRESLIKFLDRCGPLKLESAK